MSIKMTGQLVDIKQVAEKLNVSTRTIERLMSRRKFPKPIKIGRQNRWREGTIEAWLAKGER